MDPTCIAKHALERLRKPLTLREALSSVVDFRIDRRKKYPLHEILMIAVCAMICGAKGPTDCEMFGKAKIGLLKQFLKLENGIPSHDTFVRRASREVIQQPAAGKTATSGIGRIRPLLLAADRWLLAAETLRPKAV